MSERITLLYNDPDPRSGGIARYTHRILEGLEEEGIPFREVDFSSIASDRLLGKAYNILRRRRRLLRDNREKLHGVNLFLQPELYWPTSGVDIVTVHDLFLKDYREGSMYEKVRSSVYAKRFETSLRHADHFIAVSSQTKRRLTEGRIDDDEVTVVNLGVRDKFQVTREWPERDRNVGYIGDFRPRKRVGKLLAEFADGESRVDGYRLVLAGGGGNRESKLRSQYENEDGVRFQGRIPESELVDWYNDLKFLFFPTRHEGFGLPILEAAACGTPVFTYEDAAIPDEVAEYCHGVGSLADVRPALRELSTNQLIRRSTAVQSEFDWERTVAETIRVIEHRA